MRIEAEVLDVLRDQLIYPTPARVVIGGQLERGLYLRTNRVLEALGGKWDRRVKAHVFDEEAAPLISEAVVTGEVVVERDEWSFFPTPAPIADKVVALALAEFPARGGNTMPRFPRILEPSAGDGAIVRALSRAGFESPTVCEINLLLQPKLVALGALVAGRDFLSLHRADLGEFDRVVMNPPFRRGSDIRHVLHAHKLLAPSGKLVSIMSPAWTFLQTHAAQMLRLVVDCYGGKWHELPSGSFREVGTMVSTGILELHAEEQ